MHECSPELPVSVNACIDSMGVVVNHKGGVSNDLSSNQTDIEETKVELRYCGILLLLSSEIC